MGHAGWRLSADRSYAARLTTYRAGTGWFAERWTLDGPEPYAVPLPAGGPEAPGSEVLPLPDGRVLICRRDDGDRLHRLSLLYPIGPGTGELPVGTVDVDRLSLLPPVVGASHLAFALAPGRSTTTLWLVHGGNAGPRRLAEVPGHCSGGTWLDRYGRLLALDRTDEQGRTKAVAVDLARGGEVTPLLQISEDSDDRLLLADPDSGLLLVRSDAPGEERLGWGVLDSRRPVHFPDALRPEGARLTPFAVQPGQALLPERCAVALRADGPYGTWVAVWRPHHRGLRHLAAPQGWLPGAGLWTPEGELRLPYSTWKAPCGLARIVPLDAPGPAASGPWGGGVRRPPAPDDAAPGAPDDATPTTTQPLPPQRRTPPHPSSVGVSG